jgi:hypothetical protein
VKVSTRLIPCLLGVGLAVLAAGAASAEETYHINLSPPAHPGQKFEYNAQEREILKPGGTGDFYLSLDFVSVADVEACDAKGRPTRVKFKVRHLLPAITGATELIDPGSEITAQNVLVQNQPPKSIDVFTDKDDPVHPLAAMALRKVITIGNERELSEQEAFGTDKALPIGGSWTLDGEPGARLFEKMQIKVDPKHVTGKARLESKLKYDNIECLAVRMEVSCDTYRSAGPADQSHEKGTATGRLIYFISVDTGNIVESSYNAHTEVDVDGGKGYPAVKCSTDTSRAINMKPVSK